MRANVARRELDVLQRQLRNQPNLILRDCEDFEVQRNRLNQQKAAIEEERDIAVRKLAELRSSQSTQTLIVGTFTAVVVAGIMSFVLVLCHRRHVQEYKKEIMRLRGVSSDIGDDRSLGDVVDTEKEFVHGDQGDSITDPVARSSKWTEGSCRISMGILS